MHIKIFEEHLHYNPAQIRSMTGIGDSTVSGWRIKGRMPNGKLYGDRWIYSGADLNKIFNLSSRAQGVYERFLKSRNRLPEANKAPQKREFDFGPLPPPQGGNTHGGSEYGHRQRIYPVPYGQFTGDGGI